jgi:hypothetical protein
VGNGFTGRSIRCELVSPKPLVRTVQVVVYSTRQAKGKLVNILALAAIVIRRRFRVDYDGVSSWKSFLFFLTRWAVWNLVTKRETIQRGRSLCIQTQVPKRRPVKHPYGHTSAASCTHIRNRSPSVMNYSVKCKKVREVAKLDF